MADAPEASLFFVFEAIRVLIVLNAALCRWVDHRPGGRQMNSRAFAVQFFVALGFLFLWLAMRAKQA
jgi:hypothetical protein